MKYVRTKNSIREIIDDYGNCCSVKSNHRKTIGGFTIIYGLSFAPRADNIEELCDEFVLSINRMKPMLFKKHSRTNEQSYDLFKESWEIWQHNKKIDKNEHTYYGAIWTDKGLIYVAKMNDKGELELL